MLSKMVRGCAALSIAALWIAMLPADAEARGVRNTTRTSVHRTSGANVGRGASLNRNANVNRNVNRDVNRNVNTHRDIDVDVDGHYHGYGYRYGYHPVARTAAAVGVAAAATATAIAVGTVVSTLPPACTATSVGNVVYQNCSGTWYQPRYAGTQVTYMVVNPP